MNCPTCGYMMTAFETTCPRCQPKRPPQVPAPSPTAPSAFCTRCGIPRAPGVNFCGGCGAPFSAGAPASQPGPLPAAQQRPPFAQAPPPKPTQAVSPFRVIILLFLVLGGGGYVMSVVSNVQHGSLASDSPMNTLSTEHDVTYKVTGTTPSASLTFFNAGGDTQQISNAPLPWSQTFKMSSGAFMTISAQNDHDSGDVNVEIDVDGAVRKQSSSQGAYTIADTSDSL